jgi:predicted MFS family arabinose efflux permease
MAVVGQGYSRSALVALAAGSFIVLLAFGIRSSFGLFLQPMSLEFGWGREVFAFALALQNLIWGAAQPFAGAIADRFGSAKTLTAGGLLYGLGLAWMADASTPLALNVSAGVLIGLALSATGFGVVLAVVGRRVPPERRSAALGIVTATGSLGQFMMPPIGQAFLTAYGWSTALLLLAGGALAMVAAAAAVRGRADDADEGPQQSLVEALAEARRHRGYMLLTLGFFVCGWHIAFIAVHLPAYLSDGGLSTATAAWSLALIGLFNVIGAYTSGLLGGRFSKKYLLSFLYAARSLLILGFILLPLTAASAFVFSALMGLLWLSTVPLTSGLVAQIFGPRYMGMLFGIVFFSHQIGSFLGVWLGGVLYDAYGTYDPIWWASIALGLVAALLHWPIDERAVVRLRPEVAPDHA